MPWSVLLHKRNASPLALSSAQLLPFPLPSLQCCLLLSRPLCHRVCSSVFLWLNGSELGFVQQLALSEEHSKTKRGSRQEHLSGNSRFKGSPNSTETRTDRHFLDSGVSETLASNLQRVIDTTETNLECWDFFFCVNFPSIPSRIRISICLGTRLNCVACTPL